MVFVLACTLAFGQPAGSFIDWDGCCCLVETRLVLRDFLRFAPGSTVPDAYSQYTLQQIATVMHSYANIGHVVIEGHAWERGGPRHNTELAAVRADHTYRRLVEMGVAMERLSVRTSGSFAPWIGMAGDTDAPGDVPLPPDVHLLDGFREHYDAPSNHRVDFQIVVEYEHASEVPSYPPTQILPWSGRRVFVVQPPWRDIQ